MVFKLVEVNGVPRIKLSNEPSKVTLPGSKEPYRLIGSEGIPLCDLLIRTGEARPVPGRRILARHAFDEKKRVWVTPTTVVPLLRLVWRGQSVEGVDVGLPVGVALRSRFPPLAATRDFVRAQLALLREDHKRPLNPTPYKVSVSTELYHFIHDLMMREIPVPEIA